MKRHHGRAILAFPTFMWALMIVPSMLQLPTQEEPESQQPTFIAVKGEHPDSQNRTIESRSSWNISWQEEDSSSDSRRPSWQPSDQWIESCVQQQIVKKNTFTRYKVKWMKYQLGDCLKGCKSCDTSIAASRSKELSIAGEYWHRVCQKIPLDTARGNNFTFLNELFDRYKQNPFPYNQSWPAPETDELVIHLRIGDVMDEPFYVGPNASVMEMLRDGMDTSHGMNAFWPKGIRSISQYLSIIRESGLTKVVLKGGSHKAQVYPNSRIYSQCLADAIRMAGYNLTTFRVNGEDNPDHDFYYMSHAKYFVPATGGYSRLISSLVELRGGKRMGPPENSSRGQPKK